ncbi:helix-turn-helix transcriptional regulator [Enterococcus saccharolyticus]|uniref:HTH cro/C1-type domain-containing protein n=1 Tax=Candidatus Enterococcus willemsii TaxID=1857215 RepID=A0ABQ6YYC3_9ENTE|nr:MULTISPECIES: helix-turn-helix domain-containing protein [Enterococcus]KAF1303070.1 hypothetical protein BAU17_08040 [Enterococcus sp. CU12B]MCD5001580.1 helix-turn-helix transcriptional regulator [Enterococcus saccharolyticus]
MKSILDIFLQEQGKTRYEVSKATGISEATLSKANKRSPETYTVKTVATIAQAVNQTPGDVLNQLIQIRDNPNRLYLVTTMTELKQRVKEQEDEFLIQGDFSELLTEVKREQLSETAMLGFQVGSGGQGDTMAWLIMRILNLFGKNDTDRENLKQDISTLYLISSLDDDKVKLQLKQLVY